jgi:hypothetical protein
MLFLHSVFKTKSVFCGTKSSNPQMNGFKILVIKIPRLYSERYKVYYGGFMMHQTHETHTHVHGENCGHTRIKHGDHFDFLHDGHLHAKHQGHYDECTLEVSDANPDACAEAKCDCSHDSCEHERVPHGNHTDYLVGGRLHFRHDGHCDDHGSIQVL